MIVGMFLRNLGLKFGPGGLTYTCGTYKWSLSQDLKAILQFLGLDYDSWEFETQEGMFRYLASSKYFRPYFFSREILARLEFGGQNSKNSITVFKAADSTGVLRKIWNQKTRHRLPSRPMFHDWIKYVESLPESADKVDPEQVRDAALEKFGKKLQYRKPIANWT